MDQNGVMNRLEWLKSLKELFDKSKEPRLDKDYLLSLLSSSTFNLQSPSDYYANSSVKALSYREVHSVISHTELERISWDNIIDLILCLGMKEMKSSAHSTKRDSEKTMNLSNAKTVYLPRSRRAITQIKFSSQVLYLNLSGNGLKMLDIDFPPFLNVLNLADNLLVYAKFKTPLNYLKLLNIAYNRLRTLKYLQSNSLQELFAANNILEKTCDYSGIDGLRLMDLANNKIQHPEDISSNLHEIQAEAVNLSGNPVHSALKSLKFKFKVDSMDLQARSQFMDVREIAFQSSNDFNTTRHFSYAIHKRSESLAASPTRTVKIDPCTFFANSNKSSIVFSDLSDDPENSDIQKYINLYDPEVFNMLGHSSYIKRKQTYTPDARKISKNCKKSEKNTKKCIINSEIPTENARNPRENPKCFGDYHTKLSEDLAIRLENTMKSRFYVRKKLNESSMKNSPTNRPVVPINVTDGSRRTPKTRSFRNGITSAESESPDLCLRGSKTPIKTSIKKPLQRSKNRTIKSNRPLYIKFNEETCKGKNQHHSEDESSKRAMTPDITSFLSIAETRISPGTSSVSIVIDEENIKNKKPYGDPVNAMMIRPPNFIMKRRSSQG